MTNLALQVAQTPGRLLIAFDPQTKVGYRKPGPSSELGAALG